jgi:hypothetical protein
MTDSTWSVADWVSSARAFTSSATTAGGLDRRVQRQRVRLVRDVVDQIHNLTDLGDPVFERLYLRCDGSGLPTDRFDLADGCLRRLAGVRPGVGGVCSRVGDLRSGRRDLLDRRREVVHLVERTVETFALVVGASRDSLHGLADVAAGRFDLTARRQCLLAGGLDRLCERLYLPDGALEGVGHLVERACDLAHRVVVDVSL